MRLGKRKLMEVALSIRKRHFQGLLEEAREARRDIAAARRSRQKRAHILRLARKHRLSRCLEKLRPKGMTLRVGPDQHPFIGYDHRTTRECVLSLMGHRREIRAQWKQLKEESARPIAANLKTLLQETELVNGKPLEARWVVGDITLKDAWIGDIEVTMRLDEFSVFAWNISVDTEDKHGYQHPHVSSDGRICWNGHDDDAQAYHAAGDFLALKDMIENLLRTYNPRSPYITLEDWENGFGEACGECSEDYSSDDLCYSERYEESLCPNCRSYCGQCDDYVPDHHYNYEMEACDRCVELESDVCALCLERLWRKDLKTVEMKMDGKMEKVPCCETCKALYEAEREEDESEEEENKDGPGRDNHADGARLLAAGVAVSPDAQ